eukprot:comp19927_c0_seq1/m.24203 comp19927_c0_seq1/g.24203  ORF comp19927_c0_seq1/g.24203 comp19927_c0_seq1/m.24203 type:complete len:361 (-) comp19927_c0_seq1:553-1635(-)
MVGQKWASLVVAALCFWVQPGACEAYSNPTWMKDLRQSLYHKRLDQVTLPGTHNSGAYGFTDYSYIMGDLGFVTDYVKAQNGVLSWISNLVGKPNIKGADPFVISRWAKCQNYNVYAQLLGGIRYLDIQAGLHRPTRTWRTYHGFVGDTVEALLQQVRQFLAQNSEVVVVEVNELAAHPSGPLTLDEAGQLAQLITKILGAYLVDAKDVFGMTIWQMVKANRRVVVVAPSVVAQFNSQKILHARAVKNTWANTPDLSRMINYNAGQVSATQGILSSSTTTYQLQKISWTLTPNAPFILGHPSTKDSLESELAVSANNALMSFAMQTLWQGKRMGNIVVVDFFDRGSKVLDVAVMFNRRFN